MRKIVKIQEPLSLTEHRSKSHSTYENYPDKDRLRISLVTEQRGICCYCMGEIQADESKMKIEHLHSQSGYPLEQLDYSNLFGACLGNMKTGTNTHCDTFKGNKDFNFHMCTSGNIHAAIKYKTNGEIYSDNINLNNELNSVLNLNLPELIKARKSTVEGFVKANISGKLGKLNKKQLIRFRDKWAGNLSSDSLQPFCMVVVSFLETKISKL